jgi:hypothetical protein
MSVLLPCLFILFNVSALVVAQEIVNLDVDHILVEHKKNNPHIDKSFSVVRTTICGADGSIKKNVFDTKLSIVAYGNKLTITEDGRSSQFKVDKMYENDGIVYIRFKNTEIEIIKEKMFMRWHYKTDFGVVKIYNVYE